MATRHRIDEALTSERMGDVEKYFQSLTTMIDANSGIHDFKLLTADCSNVNAPFKSDQFTTFKLTDPSMDIVDISKGFITMKCDIDIQFLFKNLKGTSDSSMRENTVFFIGFKSGAHIINNYNVFSNGRMTACKNTKSKYEQTIVYNCKAEQEKANRPGMYSSHKHVREMDQCVCGTYVTLPPFADKNTTQTISFDVVIQIDDLLPFSAVSYFPRFINKELELQISCNLVQNMVFCQVPFKSVIEHKISNITQMTEDGTLLSMVHVPADYRFTQCGDYVESALGYTEEAKVVTSASVSIIPFNLNVLEAKSYIYGFNIKETTKQNIIRTFSQNNFVIPAQWVEHYTFSQLPTSRNITTNIQIPMNNACQVIMTFPNSGHQLTVSRNPHLESVQCHISDRVIPDKYFSTLDRTHAEMTMANLNLDSLFTAPEELVESLIRDRKQYGTYTLKKIDDSDYMLVFNLERFGNGCFCDGLSGDHIPINLNANYMYSDNNPHYYVNDEGTKKLSVQNINLFVVQDAFWIFTPDGGEFVR